MFAEALDDLGCGGACTSCPAPETDGDANKQVENCYASVLEAEPSLLR